MIETVGGGTSLLSLFPLCSLFLQVLLTVILDSHPTPSCCAPPPRLAFSSHRISLHLVLSCLASSCLVLAPLPSPPHVLSLVVLYCRPSPSLPFSSCLVMFYHVLSPLLVLSCLVSSPFVLFCFVLLHLISSFILASCSCVSSCLLTSSHHTPASFLVHASITRDLGP